MIGKDMTSHVRSVMRSDRLIWALLALAALPSIMQPVQLARAVQDAITLSRVSDVEAQLSVSGPLVVYSRLLKSALPVGSCLQLVFPQIEPNQAQRPYTVSGAAVLAHELHPRAVRVVPDAREAMLGAACGGRHRYILVWIEPAYPGIAEPLTLELETLRRAGTPVQLSSHIDRDGNAGYLFEVRD